MSWYGDAWDWAVDKGKAITTAGVAPAAAKGKQIWDNYQDTGEETAGNAASKAGNYVQAQYDERGRNALNRFDRAGGALDRQANNRQNYAGDFYRKQNQRFGNTATAGENLYGKYYGQKGPSYQRDLYADRQKNGFGPDVLGDRYKQRLADDGPGYEEQFYLSDLKGDNPAYQFIRDQAVKDSQRSSAARGGFVSGRAIEGERRMLADLGAKEYMNRGNLAAAAGNAQRERNRDLDTYSKGLADDRYRRATELDSLAAGATGEENKWNDFLGGRADASDASRTAREGWLGGLANSAQEKDDKYLNDLVKNGLDYGTQTGNLQQKYDELAIGGWQQGEETRIRLWLAAQGKTKEEIDSIIENGKDNTKEGFKLASGGK